MNEPIKFSFLYFEEHLKVGSCCALPHNKLRKAEFADVLRWLWERHKCIVITDEQAQAAGLRWMGDFDDSEPGEPNPEKYYEKF